MKEQKNFLKKNILKKIFIKICRLFGYEIIDQSNFYVPTQEKFLNENLSTAGKNSITLPLGETKITRKVDDLTIIFRSCTNINMLTQNKKRLFDQNKSEYTLRSLNSIINSLNFAKKFFPSVVFKIIIVDHNSKKEDLEKINDLLQQSKLKNSIINLNISEFKNIKKINEKNVEVSNNQLSNMANIYKSFMIAKNQCKDLVYFVEDDYIHKHEAIYEMIYAYERISSQLNKELFLCPTDYPYLYTKLDSTNIFLGSNKHWRKIDETLCTFLTSQKLVLKHWNELISMCEFEHYPFEKPLHKIYKLEFCLSPIPSLALHCTNINSVFGLSPNMDWKKVWDESKIL
jgi:hypothetical protein